MKASQTPYPKSKFLAVTQGLFERTLALALLALLPIHSALAQDDATKVSTEAFEFSAPKGWAVSEIKTPKGTARMLIHAGSQMRMVVQHVRVEKELNAKDKEMAKKPCMSAASFVLPAAIKLSKKAGSKPMLVFDRAAFGGFSGAGARVIVPDPASETFVAIHGIVVVRGKDLYMALVSVKGRMGRVEEGQVHHDAINQAYAMLRTMKLKAGVEDKQ